MKKGIIIVIVIVIVLIFIAILTVSIMNLGEVPILKVNADVTVTDGKPAIEIVNVEQDMVNSLRSPRGNSDVGFPSVDAMAVINYGKGGVSYWAAKEYQGNGTYELVIGFGRDAMPKQDDMVMMLVKVTDRKGNALARATRLIRWE